MIEYLICDIICVTFKPEMKELIGAWIHKGIFLKIKNDSRVFLE